MATTDAGIYAIGSGFGDGIYATGGSPDPNWQGNLRRDAICIRTRSHFPWLLDEELNAIMDTLSNQKIEQLYNNENPCDYDFIPHKHRIRAQREKIELLQAEIKEREDKIEALRHEELIIQLAGIG